MAFTGHEDNTITLAAGAALTSTFRKKYANQPKGYFFSKDTLQSMLDLSESVGIRFYFGFDTMNHLKLVFCAASADENDILDIIGDAGALCPPACGNTNALNS
jgi:hypothetical protein